MQKTPVSEEKVIKLAEKNYQAYLKEYPDPDKYLRSIDNGKMRTTSTSDWTSGFFPVNVPGIPDVPRDASAAAITASAFIEMNKYTGEKNYYLKKAKELLTSLTSDKYLYSRSEFPYFILDHSTGHHPKNSEVDVPIIYADYYLLEALRRLKHSY